MSTIFSYTHSHRLSSSDVYEKTLKKQVYSSAKKFLKGIADFLTMCDGKFDFFSKEASVITLSELKSLTLFSRVS